MDAAVHAPLLRTTVVVTDAFGRGAPQLVELFKVFGQSGIRQVTRWCTSESTELVVRRLKARMEESRVKVISGHEDARTQTFIKNLNYLK